MQRKRCLLAVVPGSQAAPHSAEGAEQLLLLLTHLLSCLSPILVWVTVALSRLTHALAAPCAGSAGLRSRAAQSVLVAWVAPAANLSSPGEQHNPAALGPLAQPPPIPAYTKPNVQVCHLIPKLPGNQTAGMVCPETFEMVATGIL